MIKKYVYGEPFETEALTENIETAEGKPGYGEICAEDGFSFTYIMDSADSGETKGFNDGVQEFNTLVQGVEKDNLLLRKSDF